MLRIMLDSSCVMDVGVVGRFLTGLPFSPSCSRTLTISMGWMMLVAPIPDKPPLR